MEYVELALAKGRLVDSTSNCLPKLGWFSWLLQRSRLVFTNDEWRCA